MDEMYKRYKSSNNAFVLGKKPIFRGSKLGSSAKMLGEADFSQMTQILTFSSSVYVRSTNLKVRSMIPEKSLFASQNNILHHKIEFLKF